MLDKDIPEINYKDVRELLVRTKKFKMIEESYKLTIFAFVEKFVSRIYGIRQINTWLSKKKGSTFFDLMIVSDCEVSYTKSLCCDSAFAHKKEFSIFKFPERFSDISWTESSLLYSLFS